MKKDNTLAIIIPSYNEEKTIGVLIDNLYKFLESYEKIEDFDIIVIDDGSVDADEGMDHMEEGDDLDELVEVDVSELMSEVRRAKRIMKENRQRAQRRQLAESRRKEDHLKRIIANEVENILS